LYYNDVELFRSTVTIDNIIHDLCSILNISRFELSIFPTSKGQFAGNVVVYDSEDNVMNNENSVSLITFDYAVDEIYFETNAEFILILEKESLFFNLVNNPVYRNNFPNSIVITGRGYPDYLTKVFVNKLSTLNIPIMYFGDCDPFGFDIYLNYLFGSKSSSRENSLLCTNNIHWIGLSHLEFINDSSLITLTQEDVEKIDHILSKEYMNLDCIYS
jgi:meiotic recombination protein SPO11